MALDSDLIPIGTTGTNDLGASALPWDNLYVDNIYSSGTIAGFWQRLLGVLSPANSTDDLAIGGTATSSAKFQVFGDTGNATTSGNLTFTGTAPTIATRLARALTIGDSQTGDILLTPGTGKNVGIGDTTPDAFLEVLGTTEQLRLTHTDGTVDSRFTVDASGNLTIDNTGTKTVLADDLQVTGGDILDSNGNESIRFGTTASAVNEATLTNAATGGIVTLAATGGDTDIALSIDSKGADALNLNGTATGDVNLAGGYGGTGCTVTNSNGNLSCDGTITGTFAGTLPWSSLIAPTANLSLAHAGYTTAFTFDSVTTADAFALSSTGLTTGTLFDLSSTSTAGGASGVSKLLDIGRSGTNSNASHTAYGLYSAVTNTGTTSTNVGGYFSASGATNNYGLIVESGNVGIGTTGPTAKLHVVGNCVTGDTLLPIKRKRKKKTSDDDSSEDEDDYLLCRIDEILPGDEVLSLNESTEALGYTRINKLMDMGIKEVYELTTKSGRTIRTTAEHPYLTLLNSNFQFSNSNE